MSGVQRLSNESDIENNEDLFDRLFAKKPVKTYRGKSISPEKRKAMPLDDHRKTLGDTPLTSPRVTKWIEEQATFRMQDNDSAMADEVFEKGHRVQKALKEGNVESPKGTPRGRARKVVEVKEQVDKNKEVSEVSKRNLRGQKRAEESPKNITGHKIKEELPKTTSRGRKKVTQAVDRKAAESLTNDEVAAPTTITQTEEKTMDVSPDEEIEFKNEKKPVRGKRKGNKPPNKTPEVSDQLVAVNQKENGEVGDIKVANEVDSTSTNTEFTLPPVKRGRPKKISHKEGAEDQIAEVHSTTEEVKSPVPKRGRGKKAQIIKLEDDSEVATILPKRNRTRKVSRDEVESTQDIVVKPNQEMIASSRPMRSRRKLSKSEEEIIDDSEAIPTVKPVPLTRGRQKDVANIEDNLQKRGRGRKATVKEEEEIATDSKVTPIGTSKERGLKEEAIPNLQKRGGRRKVAVKMMEQEIATEPERTPVRIGKEKGFKEEVAEITPRKRAAREKKIAKNTDLKADAEEITETNSNTFSKNKVIPPEPKVEVVKKTRGRRAVPQNKVEGGTPDEQKVTDKTIKVEENIAGNDTKSKPTKRTRKTKDVKKNVADKENVPEIDKSPEVVKRSGRSRKKATSEEVEGVEEGVNTIEKDSSVDIEGAVKATKRMRGMAFVDELVDVESPRTTRAKRGNFKKYGSEFVMDKEKKSKKTVHFQDKDEDNSGKGRSVTKSEEIEETSRRSKRTRK